MAVTTTVQTRRQIAEEEKQQQKEAATGIQSREILQELEEEVGEESGDGARTDGGSLLAATFDQETVSRGRDKQDEWERELNNLKATELKVW